MLIVDAITLTAWGTDFHVYVISVVLNIPIFMFTSFIREQDRIPSDYVDLSLDLTQLSAYFHFHGERWYSSSVALLRRACSKLTK